MNLKNIQIRQGESKRVVVYVHGKKHYLPLKAGKLQDFRRAHSQDMLRKSRAEASR